MTDSLRSCNQLPQTNLASGRQIKSSGRCSRHREDDTIRRFQDAALLMLGKLELIYLGPSLHQDAEPLERGFWL